MQKTISIIVPVYNEEQNIPLIHSALKESFSNISILKYNYEIIFVNDGSTDNTEKAIQQISHHDIRVKYIEFSRNFGKEVATSAGLDIATGDAAIMIDADLQHPVQLIPEFISRWEQGAEVVIGLRKKNKSDGIIKKVGSYAYYKIMKVIGETEILPGETDFRLIDRSVIDVFKTLTERQRMTRTLINWLGFKAEYISFEANNRINGKAGYSHIKLIRLALYSFVSHSLFPLRLAGYIGLLITTFSFILGTTTLIEKHILKDPFGWNVSGTAELAIINVFLVGMVLASLGLIALYIENIHNEVTNRPLYIVRKKR